MDILRKSGKVLYEFKYLPLTGVVFFYCSWSSSKLYLKYLASILDDFPTIDLFIIDIDTEAFIMFYEKYGIKSHGKGETIWLFNGKIEAGVFDYKSQKEMVKYHSIKLMEKFNENGSSFSDK